MPPKKLGRVGWLSDRLVAEDWSDKTLEEIAQATGSTPNSVKQTIRKLRVKKGIIVPYKPPEPKPPPVKKEAEQLKPENDPCNGCVFYKPLQGYEGECVCHYLLIMHRRRPCPPGEKCTVKRIPQGIVIEESEDEFDE